jgi:hypothetical protein
MLWPVYLGIKHPSGAYDQIFSTVRWLQVCWCGVLSLMRGRVCCLQLLLVFASAVTLGSESLGTRDHILLSQNWDFPFCCLLWLAGSQWRYSIPPPHGLTSPCWCHRYITPWHRMHRKYHFRQCLCCCLLIHCRGNLFICNHNLITGLHAAISWLFLIHGLNW